MYRIWFMICMNLVAYTIKCRYYYSYNNIKMYIIYIKKKNNKNKHFCTCLLLVISIANLCTT